MRLAAFLTAFILASLPAQAASKRAPIPAATPTPAPISTPVAGPHPRIDLTGTLGATPEEIKRLWEAVLLGNRELSESCFKSAVVNSNWGSTKLTGPQIYELMSKEPLKLTVEIFSGSWKENYIWHTVAYEGTGAQIRLNRHFLGSPRSIAATYIHERGGHALGFSHPYGIGTGQPYGVQRAMEQCP